MKREQFSAIWMHMPFAIINRCTQQWCTLRDTHWSYCLATILDSLKPNSNEAVTAAAETMKFPLFDLITGNEG